MRRAALSLSPAANAATRNCGEPLQIDGEIDAGQRLVEIIDVEQRIAFRRKEGAEIHQMESPQA